jgi:hypothetical protein
LSSSLIPENCPDCWAQLTNLRVPVTWVWVQQLCETMLNASMKFTVLHRKLFPNKILFGIYNR